jgi:2-oxoglutarate dehydrogenase E2 component (dihydrolipoamide succinyltransferase)
MSIAIGSNTMDIVVPTEQEGTRAIVKAWLKQVGDRVSKDEPVVELETDKVVVEVSSPCAGVLADILINPEAHAVPGMSLGTISVPSAESMPTTGSTPSPDAPASDRPRQTFDPELRLSPAVRKFIAEHDLDPSKLVGTGRGGRITREDVLAAVDERERARVVVAEAQPSLEPSRVAASTAVPDHMPRPTALEAQVTRIPHDSMRRKIAEHMQRSLNSAPHVTAVFEADFSAVTAHRKANRAAFEARGVNLTYTAYLVAASVAAMKAVPSVNSRWHDDFLEVFGDIHIGVGTALGDSGLIVPVIHKAQDLSLIGIAARLQDLTNRARVGKLKPSDVQNGTFSISNHGVTGSLFATPIIINQPQSAILGVGALEKRVIVRTVDGVDTIQIRPLAYVSLSIDHRVIDGAQTNAWLKRFVETLEQWPLTERLQ